MARRSKDASRDRFSAMEKVAARMKGWKPAREVLERVTAQPTIFPQVDCALRTGGWPLKRFALIHGPSGHGKTSFVLGLGLSFLRAGHFFGYIDAEMTTPEDWLQDLMANAFDHPGFLGKRPRSYEDTVKAVREFATTISDARKAGEIADDVTALLVVDSLRKLVPEKLLDKLLEDDTGIDGAKGRGAMMKAALNSQWMDELTPLLYHNNISMIVIGREYDNADTSQWAPSFKLGGGQAIFFDSSVVARVQRASWLRKGSGEKAKIVGECHRVRIHKTKVGGKEDKVVDAFFHTSNGVMVPAGFWRGWDVLQMATDAGLIDKKGSNFELAEHRIGNGKAAAAAWLETYDQLSLLEQECREFSK